MKAGVGILIAFLGFFVWVLCKAAAKSDQAATEAWGNRGLQKRR